MSLAISIAKEKEMVLQVVHVSLIKSVFTFCIYSCNLGVAEMLAMEMKASGMYVSRGLSFRQAEFVTIETPLTQKQTKMYDVAAHVWYVDHKCLQQISSKGSQMCLKMNYTEYLQF